MNIDLLIKAVGIATKVDSHQAVEYQKCLHELIELRAKMIASDTYKDAEACIFGISCIDIMDLTNMQCYDAYGLIRKATDSCSFEQFKEAIKYAPVYGFGFQDFTDAMLQPGYDLISDLWEENEREGSHNPNGTFKKTETVTCPDCHNDVPEGAYCIDCGCDLSMTEEDVEDSLPHDSEEYTIAEMVNDILKEKNQ